MRLDQSTDERAIRSAPRVDNREAFLRQAADLSRTPIWVECGVGRGASAHVLASYKQPGTELHLFDSWDGLPEDWDKGDRVVPRGRFKCPVPTFTEPNVTVHQGLFADTLPSFQPTQMVGLVHVDCDLYSSAKTVLMELNSYMMAGTVLVFDEIYGYSHWPRHEYRALSEWREETGHKVQWLMRSGPERAACVVTH